MKYTILSKQYNDINVEFDLGDKKIIQTISLLPYWINTIDENGKVYSVGISPIDSIDSFLKNYIVAYLKGLEIINSTIDDSIIGKTVEIN
jgi:hypothetical protein